MVSSSITVESHKLGSSGVFFLHGGNTGNSHYEGQCTGSGEFSRPDQHSYDFSIVMKKYFFKRSEKEHLSGLVS